jgi:hypothetical protein
MKKLIAISAIAPALFIATANAQSVDRVEVQAPNLTRIQAKEAFKEFKGTYDMDDGSRLTFSKAGSRYFATVDAYAPVEIRLTSPNQFATVTGRTTLTFAMDTKSPIATVTLRKNDGTLIASAGAAAAVGL